MSRIRKAYEARFRALLLCLRARKLEPGVERLTTKARQRSARDNVPLTQALTDVYEQTRRRVKHWQATQRTSAPREASTSNSSRTFLCDAGLGGLARWLRAAGYEAFWFPDIDDAELLRKAQELRSTVLTTDSLMMQRGVLRDGVIPGLWLPPTLTKEAQLALVFREFELPLRAARCMKCGGELRRVEKESVRERIPPKTWFWIDEYFLCARCGQLFWHGTHWQKIRNELEKLRRDGAENAYSVSEEARPHSNPLPQERGTTNPTLEKDTDQ
jgi:hypothetical protein